MNVLDLILYTLALICFLLAAVKYAMLKVELIALGLLFGFLVPWIHALDAVL